MSHYQIAGGPAPPRPKPVCQGNPCGQIFKANQPWQEITCRCGYGYWNNEQHKFIPGSLVRSGQAPSREQYEAHVKNCKDQQDGAPVLGYVCIHGAIDTSKPVFLGSTGPKELDDSERSRYENRRSSVSGRHNGDTDPRPAELHAASTPRPLNRHHDGTRRPEVAAGPRSSREQIGLDRTASEDQRLPNAVHKFVQRVGRGDFNECASYIDRYQDELVVPRHVAECLACAVAELKKGKKESALDWIEKAVIIDDLCQRVTTKAQRATYFSKLEAADPASVKRIKDIIEIRYKECLARTREKSAPPRSSTDDFPETEMHYSNPTRSRYPAASDRRGERRLQDPGARRIRKDDSSEDDGRDPSPDKSRHAGSNRISERTLSRKDGNLPLRESTSRDQRHRNKDDVDDRSRYKRP